MGFKMSNEKSFPGGEFISNQLNINDFDSNERNAVIYTTIIVVCCASFFAFCAYIFM